MRDDSLIIDQAKSVMIAGVDWRWLKNLIDLAERLVQERDDLKKRMNKMMYQMMEHHIARYLIVNTIHREDGAAKAEHHTQLSYIYVASRLGISRDRARLVCTKSKMKLVYRIIHDATRDLTDHMDTVIGFPVYVPRPPYEELEPKFFDEFIRLADNAWAEIEDDIEDDY